MTEITVQSTRIAGTAACLRGPNWRMVGQDGGLSIPLGDGRSLFVFSDTLLAPADSEGGGEVLLKRRQGVFLANCAAIAGSAEGGLAESMAGLEYFADETGRPREIVEVTGLERMAGYRIWPQHGVRVGDRVYLYYMAVRQVEGRGVWGFENVGCGLAVLELTNGLARRLRWDGEWRLWPEVPVSCHVGVQVVREGGWVYSFTSRADGLEFRAFLMRVREEAIEEPEAYEAYMGDGWSGNWRESATLGECGREFSVSWNEFVGGYVMVYMEPFLRRLRMRVSQWLWGPYGEALDLGRVPSDGRTELVSLAFEHPQYGRDGGRELAISYSQPYFLQNTLVSVRLKEASRG